MLDSRKIDQSGGIVTLQRFCGWSLSVLGICVFLIAIPAGARLYFQGVFTFFQVVGVWIVNLACGAGLMWMGSYLLGKYPDIVCDTDGLNVKSGFIKYSVKWQEITGVESVKKDMNRIVFVRRGMLLNRLYGSLLAGLGDKPVILVRKNARYFNGWEEFIGEHISMER